MFLPLLLMHACVQVIIFYSLLPNGDGDVTSQHSACPVTSGVKWAANKWVWNGKPYFK